MNALPIPGPWTYKRQGFKITIGTQDTGATKHGHDYTIATIDDNSFQAEANAALISAAPDLLAAAKSCQFMADNCNNAMLPDSVQELLKAIETTLSKAIKKAQR